MRSMKSIEEDNITLGEWTSAYHNIPNKDIKFRAFGFCSFATGILPSAFFFSYFSYEVELYFY